LRPCSRYLFVHVFPLTALLLAGLLLALLAALLRTSLLASLAALLALAATLSLLTALAALLSGTILVISHREFSALVDRGCAPTSEPPARGLVPHVDAANAWDPTEILLQWRAGFYVKSFSNRVCAQAKGTSHGTSERQKDRVLRLHRCNRFDRREPRRRIAQSCSSRTLR
jgi:hypothetical protein